MKGALAAAPPGFVALREAGGRWIVEAGRVGSLRAARLLEPAGVEAALRAASGPVGRARTAVVAAGDLPLVLRGVRRGGLLGPLLGPALPGPRRPLDELAVTARLRNAGAPVPQPVLAGAWRCGPVWAGVVATALEPDAVDADVFLRREASRRVRDRALASAGRAVRRFHDAGGAHPDLHLKNLLVRRSDDAFDVLVIDLDRARHGAALDAVGRMRELMRLYRSLLKRDLARTVGPRGCAAFFGAYVGRDRELRRALLARLPAERRRVAVHALAYRRPG